MQLPMAEVFSGWKNIFTVGDEEYSENAKSNDINLTIFPNPSSDNISVTFNLNRNSDVQLKVFDLGGKLMYSRNIRWPQ